MLRPGRFDRQVPVERPDVKGREQILRIHAKNVKLDGAVDFAHDAGDVETAFMRLGSLLRPCLRIADVVEVNAVDVVFAGHLGTDVGNIVASGGILGIHETFLSDTAYQLRVLAFELLEARLAGLANRNGYHPGVTLHSPLVALVDDELQGVVAGIAAVGSRETHIERLDAGRVDGRGTHSCLDENRIDVHPLQLVEYAYHFLFLGGGCLIVWPVDAPDGGKPDGANLMLLSLRRQAEKRQYDDDFCFQFVICF